MDFLDRVKYQAQQPMMHNLFICIGHLRKEILRLPGLLSLLIMSYYLFIREIGEDNHPTHIRTQTPCNLDDLWSKGCCYILELKIYLLIPCT